MGELALIIAIVSAAALYIGLRLRRSIKAGDEPCDGGGCSCEGGHCPAALADSPIECDRQACRGERKETDRGQYH